MLKKTSLVLAIMALLVTGLLAQKMRVEGNIDPGPGGRGTVYKSHRMSGENDYYHAVREDGAGMGMNNRKGDGNCRNNMMPGSMVMAMAEEIELTTTQINNIKEYQASFKKESNTKQAEIENLLIDKRDAMRKQDFKKATTVTKSIFKVREQIALSKITTMENIYKELTKVQIGLLKANCKN